MALQVVHGTYFSDSKRETDCTHLVLADTVTGKREIRSYRDETISVWVTKPQLQKGQNTSLIAEKLENLDRIRVKQVSVVKELGEYLFPGKKFFKKTDVFNSPFVYGANIPIEVRRKQKFLKDSPERILEYTVAALDFETSMVNVELMPNVAYGGIIISSYCDKSGTVYQFIDRNWLQDGGTIEEIYVQFAKDLAELYSRANKKAKEILDKYKPTLRCFVVENEVQVMERTIDIIHTDKPDFCSIWNIDFDVPKLLDRMAAKGISKFRLCHPSIPKGTMVCSYHKDGNKKLQHPSHAWNFFECSGFTQFFDSQGLFSRLRKHKGVQDSYKLDDVAKQALGVGKIAIEDKGHYAMQRFHRVAYASYGAVDSLITFLLEKRNGDINSLTALTESTLLKNFAQQTVMLTHSFYDYCMDNNMVCASRAGKVSAESDAEISNVGGNVIHPGLATGTYSNKLNALQGIHQGDLSKVVMCVSDLDVRLHVEL